MKTKPFNLEEALAGKPVVTRDGGKVVEIKKMEADFPRCLAVLFIEPCGGKRGLFYTKDGKYATTDHDYDLLMEQETHIVNGYKVAKPVDYKLENRDDYYIPNLSSESWYDVYYWVGEGDYEDITHLHRGLIHLDEKSAIENAKAMCGVNPFEGNN